MSNAPMISLIFPAYNEAQHITQTVTEAKQYFTSRGFSHEIIVSADGSDETREIVSEMTKTDPTLKVIGNIERRGKGYGIRQAIPLTTGVIVGFADADNKTPISEFDKIEPLLHTHDIVIGSRGLKESRIEQAQPLYRQIGSKGFGVYMRAITGLHDIIDTQCGFKFLQRNVAVDLFSRQKIDGYMYDVEILYLARRAGYTIAQVPIRWRDDGDSRLQLISGNIRNALDVLRIRFASAKTAPQISLNVQPANKKL